MSATVEEIREALAGALTVIPGLQTSGYMLSNPTLPFAGVKRGDVDYDRSMIGADQLHGVTMTVTVLVADLNDIGAAKILDQYLAPDGALSVKQAVEADTSLGGLVEDLRVTGANGEQTFVREGGGPMLGSEWTVDIWL